MYKKGKSQQNRKMWKHFLYFLNGITSVNAVVLTAERSGHFFAITVEFSVRHSCCGHIVFKELFMM